MKFATGRIPTPFLGPLLLGATALLLSFTPQANAQTETIGGGTVTSPAVGPAPSYGIGGSSMVLVKNWHFGADGTIKNYADMSANFFYHDQFGTIGNGTNYGAVTVSPDAANALYNQPIEGVNSPPVRQFTADSLQTFLTPLNGATTVDPNLHNAGNGSFMAKWTLPNGGSLLGQDIVWETRVRYVTPPYFWFALWTAGNKWKWDGQAQGAEQDLIESFGYDNGGGYTNFDGRYWHSNTVASPTKDTVDYSNWGNAMAGEGIPSYDATQYHIWTWYYKKDNTFAMYVDGIKVQSGSNYSWTYGNTAADPPINMDFLFDAGWGHTQVQSVDHPLPASAFTGKLYEFNYSRVYLSPGPAEAVYNGPHNIPGTVQIEDYDLGGEGVAYHATYASNGSQTGYRADNNGDIHAGAGPGGNNYAIGWSYTGDWYKYTVSVATAGPYTAAFQVASSGAGGTFHLEDEAGNNLTGSLSVPDTGGWGSWQTVTSPAFSLSTGTHTLRLVEDANGPSAWVADFDWMSLTSTNHPPTVVSAAAASAVVSNTATLSVLGADDGGEQNLTYTWNATGPAPVTLTPNATNAAKNTVATFTQPGPYTLTATITDAQGLSVTSSVALTVLAPQTLLPTADAFVWSGPYANQNKGTLSSLATYRMSNDSLALYNKCAYLKFDLTGLTQAPASALLSLSVDPSSYPASRRVTINLYSEPDTTWLEKALTWNNAPGLNRGTFSSTGSLLGSQGVSLVSGTVASYDVTSFVSSHLGQVVSFQVINPNVDRLTCNFRSREAATGKPTLTLKF